MNIKWFKRLFTRRQKSITMFDGSVLYRRIIPEIVSIEAVYIDIKKESSFILHLTERKIRAYYSNDRDILESERNRLIGWVDSWM